ncbi:hypothetical protein [Paracoccus sp. PAR01]|uniref:hypothetical protein n=1 Tax=Paracoccus sp. PAR01 TaxID=2769282 RepID=UPI00177FC518|nr:hypothetical protein [Paracoccus sp. PAR01]MBD9527832.1 hypothetical protein [Paracoccus sp. PAR01]
MTRDVALHELRHGLACGVALVALGIDRQTYDQVKCHFHVASAYGEFGLSPDGLPEHVRAQASELMAVGPCAALERAVPVLLSDNAHARSAVFRDAALSAEDLDLAARWNGPPATPAVIVRAVQCLESGIGLARVARLCQLVRKIDAADLDQLPRLKFFVPFDAASQALTKARLNLHARKSA